MRTRAPLGDRGKVRYRNFGVLHLADPPGCSAVTVGAGIRWVWIDVADPNHSSWQTTLAVILRAASSSRAAHTRRLPRRGPEPQRSTLQVLRSSLRELLPVTREVLSCGMPAVVVNRKPVAGYAWTKHHCSYLPHSGAVLAELADLLEGYDWSKGTLRFAVDDPLPQLGSTSGSGPPV